ELTRTHSSATPHLRAAHGASGANCEPPVGPEEEVDCGISGIAHRAKPADSPVSHCAQKRDPGRAVGDNDVKPELGPRWARPAKRGVSCLWAGQAARCTYGFWR